jgi:hypothetical protein
MPFSMPSSPGMWSVSPDLAFFNVAARPARKGRNPQTGEAIQIAASKAVRFHAGKVVKDALNPTTQKGAPRKKTAPPKKSAVRK